MGSSPTVATRILFSFLLGASGQVNRRQGSCVSLGMTERNRSRLIPVFAAVAVLAVAAGFGLQQLGEGEPEQPVEVQANTLEATQSRTQVATYQSATVYAASTDFYFEDRDGEIVEFRVSNLPEAQTMDLPEDMLEAEVVEGPPGPNPDLVGEEFLLVYDDQDRLIRVERS